MPTSRPSARHASCCFAELVVADLLGGLLERRGRGHLVDTSCRSASCTAARRRGSRCGAATPTDRCRARAARQSIICSRATVSIIHGPRTRRALTCSVCTVLRRRREGREPVRAREQHRSRRPSRSTCAAGNAPAPSRKSTFAPSSVPSFVGGHRHRRHVTRVTARRPSRFSRRSWIHFTGRPSRCDASAVAISSARGFILSPNAPPTSGMITRTWLSSSAERLRHERADVVRTLGRDPDGELLAVRLPARHDAARLHRHR